MLCNSVGLNTNEPLKALSVDYLAPGDSITLPFTADKIGDTKVEVTLNELPSIDDLDRIIIRSRSSIEGSSFNVTSTFVSPILSAVKGSVIESPGAR